MPDGDSLTVGLAMLTAIGLGLSAGALLAEGAVLVPMWQRQSPADFLRGYREHAALLLRFFGPLEAAPAVLALVSVGARAASGLPASIPAWGAAASAVAVLLFFPVFFKRANAAFERAEISEDEVPAALARWAKWHWARTAVATLALLCALFAIA